ncbi:MAG: prepilin-type N-terminal cleavage/methylation domain-containing protein [Clostridia bacterium]|nr:prepilin-type N-terminal cleavage/methylation domain-containing protein [Clostridia bacterium]
MNNKKAFTVVELVIVIAIIAILAAVLIPTFASMVRSANVSADTQLIKNLNTSLRADLPDGKHPTMHDALKAAEAFGYDVDKINASAVGNEILWDQRNDVFCYVKGEEVIYIPESVQPSDRISDVDSCELWKIYNAKSGAVPAAGDPTNPQTNSIYLGPDANYSSALDNNGIFNVTVGIDVGNQPAISSIKYENNTNDGKSVVIRTNGGTLTVNAPNDTVSHYGFATVVNVNDVDDNCYNENGTVGRLIYSDNDGKIYFGDTAVVYCYMNTSTDTAANAEFPGVKAANAIVYTYVDSGEDEAKGYAAADNKEDVTVTDGIVEISTCFNHNEDYDIIYIGDDIYIICKCCGAFSRISTDANGTTTVESSEGIGTENQEHETNEFIAKNNSSLPIINAVATIGYTKYYSTLAAAVADAVNGDTITMLKNDLLTGEVNITKKISLDLNGKQVGRAVNTLTTALKLSNGELIINDSVGTGSVLANAQAIGMTNSNDKLIINGGKIQGDTYGVRIQKGNTVEIDGATIIGGTGGHGIFNQAAQTLSISNANISGANAIKNKASNANITISNSTLIGSSCGIYNEVTASITVSNSELTGTSYGINSTATATITVSESTISATASNSYAIQSTGGNSNVTVENSNISGGNRAINSSKANSSVTVKSGTISGGTYGIVNSGTLSVTDGTIKADSYYGVFNSGTLTMDGGTIIGGTHESYGKGIYNNGTAIINGGVVKMNVQTPKLQVAIDNRKNLTINDCTITSDTIGVYSTDSFTFAGGIITAAIEGIQNYGTASLSGGEILVENVTNKVNTMGILNYNTVTISGDIVIVNNNAYTSEPKLDDNGEVELDEKGEPKLIEYIPYGILSNGTTDNKANIAINGGSISAPDGFALTLSHTDAIIKNGTLSGANAIVSSTYDSTCTISDGMFNATGSQVCYAQNGKFTISGGVFTGGGSSNPEYASQPYRFTLNCLDGNRITKEPTDDYPKPNAWFYVTGGTFYQFNPQNNLAEGQGTDFTNGNVTVTYNDATGYHTVTANN